MLTILVLFGCSDTRTIAVYTKNPNTPVIYKNGFKDYGIVPILSVKGKDTIATNELRFNAVYSALYSGKLMYGRFGKWNKIIRDQDERNPLLIWENIPIFKNNNERYTVTTSGIESWGEMYTSVTVRNSKNEDCLSEKAAEKGALIQYFSEGIKSGDKTEKFYNEYHKLERKEEAADNR